MNKGFPVNASPIPIRAVKTTPTDTQRRTAEGRMARFADNRAAQVAAAASLLSDVMRQLAEAHNRTCTRSEWCGQCALIGEGVAVADAYDAAPQMAGVR